MKKILVILAFLPLTSFAAISGPLVVPVVTVPISIPTLRLVTDNLDPSFPLSPFQLPVKQGDFKNYPVVLPQTYVDNPLKYQNKPVEITGGIVKAFNPTLEGNYIEIEDPNTGVSVLLAVNSSVYSNITASIHIGDQVNAYGTGAPSQVFTFLGSNSYFSKQAVLNLERLDKCYQRNCSTGNTWYVWTK